MQKQFVTYHSPSIPFKGLPSEIFMLVHEFYCTLNIKFSIAMQWIMCLENIRKPRFHG